MDNKGISRAGIVGIIVVIVIIAAGAGYFLLGGGPSEGETPIKIGVVGPQKQMTGKQHIWGAELAVEQINEQGGLLGRPLKIVPADTEANPTVARSALERVIKNEGADVIVGGQRTEAVLAMQDVMAEHEIIFMGCGAADDDLVDRVGKNYEKYKYFFMREPPVSSDMGIGIMTGLLGFLAGDLGDKLGEDVKIAICAEKIDWTEGLIAAIKAYAPKYGMEVIKTVRPSPTATDVTSELSIIEGTDANVIATVISGTVGVPFAKQWGEMEISALPVGINVEAAQLGFWDRTKGKSEYSVISFTLVKGSTPISNDFLEVFRDRHQEYPGYNSYGAYTGIFEWAEAVHRAGTLEEDNVIEELEYTPDPMEWAHFERFGQKVPQFCGVFAQDVGFTENHYIKYYPRQEEKMVETVAGPLRASAGWPWGQWVDGEVKLVYPEKWAEAEVKLPPWIR